MAVEARVENDKNGNSLGKYLREVKAEFKKITWASRDEVVRTTSIVLTVVAIVTLIIWAFDSAFGIILKSLLNNFS
jgi:preprotein translocase subunit SecE